MRTSLLIKELVEMQFDIPDISVRKRDRDFVYIRYVYYALCRKFSTESYETIAQNLGQDHSTMVHALVRFTEYTTQEFFQPYMKVYESVSCAIKDKNKTRDIEIKHQLSDQIIAYKIQQKYDQQLTEVIRDSHRRIQEIKRTSILLSEPVFVDVSSLPEADFEEFKRLTTHFVNRKKREYATN